MPKGLFLSLPAHGHTNPSLPLVRELVAQGDEVVYYSTPPFRARVEATGATFRPYDNTFLADLRGLPDRLDALGWLLMRTTAELLETTLGAWRAERPDYLVTDASAPWGQWAGEALGVPVVTSISTFAFNRHVLAFGVRQGLRPSGAGMFFSKLRYIAKAVVLARAIRRRYHLKGPAMATMMFGQSGLNVLYTSRQFQPCAETFDDRYVFVGPSMAPRTHVPDFPWSRLDHRPLVYVSLGTLFNTSVAFYQQCFDAFRDRDVQVVMSVGTNVVSDELGSCPANVIVRTEVPQLDVLERASVFVTHGGMNSVSEGLYYGVPLLVIPQMGEQALIGRRVEQLGAGVFLAKDEVTSDRLWQSVSRVLADDRFRVGAAHVRDSFLGAGGVARAVGAIRDYRPA